MSSALPDPNKCPHCGGFHDTTCHLIKAIEYEPNGTIRRIEFHGPVATAPVFPPSDDYQWWYPPRWYRWAA